MSKLRKKTSARGNRRLHRRRWRSPEAQEPSYEDLIEAAAEEAQISGRSLTAIRKHVLHVLLNAQRPLTAYEVLDSLVGVGSFSPPTAYRALDFLIELGFVKRVETLNAYLALPLGPSDAPVALFVCKTCGQAEEVGTSDMILALLGSAANKGFAAKEMTLELRGDCQGRLGCATLEAKLESQASPPEDAQPSE